jgi:hypothetical protein
MSIPFMILLLVHYFKISIWLCKIVQSFLDVDYTFDINTKLVKEISNCSMRKKNTINEYVESTIFTTTPDFVAITFVMK